MKQVQAKYWVLLLFLIALIVIGFWRIKQYPARSNQEPRWQGKWTLSYAYENNPELLFSGQLEVLKDDPFQAELELFPPQSERSESVELSNITTLEPNMLSGELVHNGYKINGGFLKESFEWVLIGADSIQGVGQCLAFCAEGTSNMKISWTGRRVMEDAVSKE